MAGFLGFAPIYLHGLLALFFIFVLPGLMLVRAFRITTFPQHWLVVIAGSLTANYFLVTLIAALQFDPLWTFRAVTAVLIAALLFMVGEEKCGHGDAGIPGRVRGRTVSRT